MRCKGGDGGFTLFEVLIALSVMSIAMLALINVLAKGLAAQGKSESTEVARLLADKVLERSIRDLNELKYDQNIAWEGDEVVGNSRYSFTVSSTDVQNKATRKPFGTATGGQDNRLKAVLVRVRWGDGNSRAEIGKQEVAISRLVNRRLQ
jgi:prepilin-type N-terminal cleavage/methylation domain-containing protein